MRRKLWQVYVLILTLAFYLVVTPVAWAGQGNAKDGNNKGQTKQLQSINQKLDRIDTKLANVTVEIDNYFTADSGSTDGTEETTPPEEVTPEEQVDGTDGGDATVQPQETTPAEEVTPEEQPAEQVDGTDGSDVTVQPEETTPAEEVTPEEDEVVDEEESADDESSEEDESISGYSLIGKLDALNNQLNVAESQLLKLTGVDTASEDYVNTTARIGELRDKISEQISRLDTLESPVREKLMQDLDEQEEFPVASNIVSPDKVWSIKFSRSLNEDTMSRFNIFVVDADNNLVPVTVTFDSAAGAVLVTPNEPYQPGQYTLFISKDVTSTSGDALKNATKVQFEVQ